MWFFREHRGQPLPSAALMSPISRRFVATLEAFPATVRSAAIIARSKPPAPNDHTVLAASREARRQRDDPPPV